MTQSLAFTKVIWWHSLLHASTQAQQYKFAKLVNTYCSKFAVLKYLQCRYISANPYLPRSPIRRYSFAFPLMVCAAIPIAILIAGGVSHLTPHALILYTSFNYLYLDGGREIGWTIDSVTRVSQFLFFLRDGTATCCQLRNIHIVMGFLRNHIAMY